MMKHVLSLAVVAIPTECTSTPDLLPRDTIVAMKPTEFGIAASLARYSYRFVRDGVPQEYQRYKTFYERFHQQALGVRANSVVEQHEVTTEYLVVIDQRKLDTGQHSELVNQYHVVQIDNDRPRVLFKATGFWTASDASDLAVACQSAHSMVVSINDKIKTTSSPGAVAMAPLFPFYMMYGRTIGSCARGKQPASHLTHWLSTQLNFTLR